MRIRVPSAPQAHDVAAPLIPKKNGKLRDLGFFAGFIKVCTKARNKYCREREATNDRPDFACGAARSTVDTVWRAAIRTEGAQAGGSNAAFVLQDMESFYQMINHSKLAHRAEQNNFPLPMLRLSVHLCSGPRHLMLGKSIAMAVIPNRGMPPGCSWAGTLVKVYYIGPFDAYITRHPQVGLDVYVDDIQDSATGTDEAITTRLTEATEDFNSLVEHQIESSLVPTKAAVVASSDKLACKLRAALGELAGASVNVTEALGIDFASARPRRNFARSSKILAWIRATAKRRARFKVVSKFGGKKAQKLQKQCANPAALYGAAVTGLNEDVITQVRHTAACGTPPYACRAASRTCVSI